MPELPELPRVRETDAGVPRSISDPCIFTATSLLEVRSVPGLESAQRMATEASEAPGAEAEGDEEADDTRETATRGGSPTRGSPRRASPGREEGGSQNGLTALEIMQESSAEPLDIKDTLTALDTYVRGQTSDSHARALFKEQLYAAFRVGCWTMLLTLPITIWPVAEALQAGFLRLFTSECRISAP